MNSPLAQRYAAIRATLPEGEDLFVAVQCNYCGQVEAAATVAELERRIVGWTIAETSLSTGMDICRHCKQ